MVAATAVEMRLGQLARAFKGSFNPDQTRIPAGQPGGGQWTNDNGSSDNPTGIRNASSSLADELILVGARSEHFCWNQLTIDTLYCNSLQPPWWAASCRSQAMQRYAACITGKPVPPLPF